MGMLFANNDLLAFAGAIFLFLLLAVSIVLFLLLFLKRRHQHAQEMTELQYNYEQTLLRSRLEIQEETLRTISQEIHDNIGQVLSLAKLHLNTLPVEPLAENAEAISQTKELVSKAITDLRGLSKSLHPDRVNELGLEENIRHELDMLRKTRLYEVGFKISGSPYKIPVQTQTILFRMVQEAINNIIKHARANRVEIVVDYDPVLFCLSIQDNGVGFSTDAIADIKSGIGIKNMQNRSTVIGATFKLLPVAEGGTEISICLPPPAVTD